MKHIDPMVLLLAGMVLSVTALAVGCAKISPTDGVLFAFITAIANQLVGSFTTYLKQGWGGGGQQTDPRISTTETTISTSTAQTQADTNTKP